LLSPPTNSAADVGEAVAVGVSNSTATSGVTSCRTPAYVDHGLIAGHRLLLAMVTVAASIGRLDLSSRLRVHALVVVARAGGSTLAISGQ
jgi:hypothetical protein